MYEYEFESEALPEFEDEYEFEGEFENEFEEPSVVRQVQGIPQRLPMARIGQLAARAALDPGNGPFIPESEFEFEYEGESEYEYEDESEAGLNPIRRVYPDALMEHLGHAATEAESEAEAEAFIGALVPMAARMAPRVLPAIARFVPHLIRAAANIARTLRRNPVTRPLVRAIPTIVQRTIVTLTRMYSRRQQITVQIALRILARHASQILGNQRRSVQVIRRSTQLDRHHHRNSGAANPPIPGRRPGRCRPEVLRCYRPVCR